MRRFAAGRAECVCGGDHYCLQPMRLLIAEDETIIRLDLRELLERAGFEICAEARDGLEAV